MSPFFYAPPPRPVTQVVVIDHNKAAHDPVVIPVGDGEKREFANRKERRTYQATVLRRIRRRVFTKALRAACPLMVSLPNVRAELRGMI